MAALPATILVVDDDMPILDMLTEMLEECGHTALRAMNGKQALVLAQQHHPDIIITDVMMPIMDGYELVKAVRSVPSLARTAVVLASAGVAKLRPMAQSLHVDGYVQKPFSLCQIEALIETFIERSRASFEHQVALAL